MTITFPQLAPEVNRVIAAVTGIGGRPIVVGGSVRDAIMGMGTKSKDVDIEVYGNVSLDEITSALATVCRADAVGRSFGVLKATTNGHDIDISLPRSDSKTGTGHRGFTVTTDAGLSFAEASARRDFTINSIMVDPATGEVIDCHGGLADLEAGILRHTSDAFGEDPLRVLRGVQFAARFGFTMAPETVNLCRGLLLEFSALSIERVWNEFEKIGTRGTHISAALEVLKGTFWAAHFSALVNMIGVQQDPRWHPEGDVWTHAGLAADEAARLADLGGITGEDRLVLVFAALLHDVGKPPTTKVEDDGRVTAYSHDKAGVDIARDFLFSIGCPHGLTFRILPLIREHMNVLTKPTTSAVHRMARRLQPATMAELAIVSAADVNGRGMAEEASPADAWLEMSRSLRVEERPAKGLLTGDHLITAGLKPGPAFKTVLATALAAQDDGVFEDEDGAVQWLERYLVAQ